VTAGALENGLADACRTTDLGEVNRCAAGLVATAHFHVPDLFGSQSWSALTLLLPVSPVRLNIEQLLLGGQSSSARGRRTLAAPASWPGDSGLRSPSELVSLGSQMTFFGASSPATT